MQCFHRFCSRHLLCPRCGKACCSLVVCSRSCQLPRTAFTEDPQQEVASRTTEPRLEREAPDTVPGLLPRHTSDFRLLLLLLLPPPPPPPPHTPSDFQSSSHTPGSRQPVCVQPRRGITLSTRDSRCTGPGVALRGPEARSARRRWLLERQTFL